MKTKQITCTDNTHADVISRSCDVLIVGAGPAGGAAALAASRKGLNVVMIDRRRQIGTLPQCAGYIPAAVMTTLSGDVISASISNRIEKMLTYTPEGRIDETGAPGYIVRRDLFDRCLSDQAAASGAIVLPGARALAHRTGETMVRTTTGTHTIRSRVTIGADGPRSTVGSWMGSNNRRFVVGAQWTLPLLKNLTETRIYFDLSFRGGYAWFFPCGKNANAGVGVEAAVGLNPVEALKWFVGKLAGEGLVEKRPLARTGGLIPVGGMLGEIQRDDLVLAGDAAGLCHPVAGAGIAYALQSGHIAGLAASRFAAEGGTDALPAYAEEIEELFGASLDDALRRRRRIYNDSNMTVEEFSQAVGNNWISSSPALI